MAEQSKAPAWVVIDYHSAYGKHKATLLTREWFPTGVTGDLGSYQAWDASTIDGEDMINAMVDALAANYLSTTHFDLATVYTQASPSSVAIPRKAKALTQVGSSTATGQAKAVQQAWMFRDDEYFQAKLYFLDAPVGANFDPITDITGVTAAETIRDEFTGNSNAWSTRHGLRPSLFQKITFTMNEKLRREYGMT